MDPIVNYLARSVLVSGLLLGYYQLMLRNRGQHGFNRTFLLTALMASLILPLVRLSWLNWDSGDNLRLEALISGVAIRPAASHVFPWTAVILAVAGTISLSLLLLLAFRVRALYRLRRRYVAERRRGFLLIRVKDPRAPFSFFSNLFWQQGADVDDPVHRRILDHELSHIRGRHTYDTLFAQLVAAVFWINPFYWLIRRELAMVHEFIADEASLAAGDSEGFAQMLLQAYDDGRYLDPSHRFFHSPIKRRLTMITTNRRSARWGMLLALPALMAVMTLSCSKEDAASAQKTPPLPPPPPAQGQVFKVKLLKDSLYRQIKADVDRRVMNVYYVTVVGKNAKRLTYSLSSKEDLDNVSRGVLIKGVFVQKMQKPVIVTDKQE